MSVSSHGLTVGSGRDSSIAAPKSTAAAKAHRQAASGQARAIAVAGLAKTNRSRT